MAEGLRMVRIAYLVRTYKCVYKCVCAGAHMYGWVYSKEIASDVCEINCK